MGATADRPWTRSYAPGIPATIAASAESLVGLLTDAARRFGSRVALDFFGAATTYAELADQVDRAAEALRRLGVGRGDRVALVLPNCPQHVVAFYAVLRLGAVVVEHNPLYTAQELEHQLTDTAPGSPWSGTRSPRHAENRAGKMPSSPRTCDRGSDGVRAADDQEGLSKGSTARAGVPATSTSIASRAPSSGPRVASP
ncbi:AMP-binding enzyme [Micromonospora inositola]|uniref:AMP-binding enzyme n=1 Tax=Micromonospora inositola TaxID=47865 RepID=A0A1C5JVT4_9ACTN|nr:AMP-binding enzyme [Micromonospora inositola]